MKDNFHTANALKRKRDSLKAVVSPWLTAKEKDLPRMTSQINAAVNLLEGLLRRIDSDLERADLHPMGIESRILAAYQFWNVFRTKFEQRRDPAFERFLKAADELAYKCYIPARDAAFAGDVRTNKEPPLVYFSGEASPFIDPRNKRFHPDGIPAQLIQAYGWPEAASRLPFAMIGVPWYQLGFLPGALAIGHEVGHSIESDFALTAFLQEKSVAQAEIPRQERWRQWTGEMFADFWGCLALGPAFFQALSDLLWTECDFNAQANFSGEYPPDILRICWNWKVLDQLGLSSQVEALWKEWFSVGKNSVPSEFFDEATKIASTWVKAPVPAFGNKKFPDLLTFTTEQSKHAHAQAKSAQKLGNDSHSDVRVLWAAIQIVFEAPATEMILDRILAACDDKARRASSPQNQQEERNQYVQEIGSNII